MFGILMDDARVPYPVPFGRRSYREISSPPYPMPYGRVRLGRRSYGWVDATGGGDDPAPTPGTQQVQNDGSSGSSQWVNLGTSILNLGAGIANAVAHSQQPQSGASGFSCPSGYYYSNGRCVPAQQSSGFGISSGMVLAGVGILGAALLFSKRG